MGLHLMAICELKVNEIRPRFIKFSRVSAYADICRQHSIAPQVLT